MSQWTERFVKMGALLVPVLVCTLIGAAGAGEGVDWARYADERTVTATTTNEDGSSRETTIWLVVVGGQGYIRTGSTRWGANLERTPNILLRVGEDDFSLRVHFVTDPFTRDEVKKAFRAKYGFPDWIMNPFRGRNPSIMRLLPRVAE